MRVIHDVYQANLDHDSVLTIGAFDGLHLGHQELLKRLMASAREGGRLSGVVTFDPIPRALFQADSGFICLTTIEDKITLLQGWGLDLLVVFSFTHELSRQSAREFMRPLVEHLRLVELWIGWNFALGRDREGNVSTLQAIGREMGYEVRVLTPVGDGATVISSTQIRNLLGAGRVREASEMLGRYYAFRGTVVRGSDRGKAVGFPTANLQVENVCTLPGSGVYATYVVVDDRTYLGVANIGVRPTFGNGEPVVEVHLLEYEGALLGKRLELRFVERLRNEQRFGNMRLLRAQIRKDIDKAAEILR